MRLVPIIEDDFDQYEEEEVIYVDDGLEMSRNEDGYFCGYMDYKYSRFEPPISIAKKDL